MRILELKEFMVLVDRAYKAEELIKEKKKIEAETRNWKKRSMFLQEIYEAQRSDKELQAKRKQCEADTGSDFRIGSDSCLMFKDLICVPKNNELIRRILHEAHNGCLSVHPGSTKMYNDLKQ